MAISVTPTGGKPTPGVVSLHARTDTNKETHTVVISDFHLTDTRFPSADAATAENLEQLVHSFFKPDETMTISLDRLMAEVEEGKVSGTPVQVDNNPPKIFVSRGPSVLLLVDGKEVRSPIEKTNLEFVVNANWAVLFDKGEKKYYLLNGKQWLTAATLEGPWTATAQIPQEMNKLPADENWGEIKKAIPPQGTAGTAPAVFFSSVPAELIDFDGAPVYAKIPGTQLTYATNTQSAVFVQTNEQKYYFLVVRTMVPCCFARWPMELCERRFTCRTLQRFRRIARVRCFGVGTGNPGGTGRRPAGTDSHYRDCEHHGGRGPGKSPVRRRAAVQADRHDASFIRHQHAG